MTRISRYAYEKKIKSLEDEVSRLSGDIYEYRTACSEIYDGVIQILEKGSTAMNVGWLLGRLKSAWRKL